jgi:hypothetical protein
MLGGRGMNQRHRHSLSKTHLQLAANAYIGWVQPQPLRDRLTFSIQGEQFGGAHANHMTMQIASGRAHAAN